MKLYEGVILACDMMNISRQMVAQLLEFDGEGDLLDIDVEMFGLVPKDAEAKAKIKSFAAELSHARNGWTTPKSITATIPPLSVLMGEGGGGGAVVSSSGRRSDAGVSAEALALRTVRAEPPGVYCRGNAKGCTAQSKHSPIAKADPDRKWWSQPLPSNANISTFMHVNVVLALCRHDVDRVNSFQHSVDTQNYYSVGSFIYYYRCYHILDRITIHW